MTYYISLLKEFKNGFMLYMPLSIILQSCLGSIAVLLISINANKPTFFFELFVCVSITMLYNVSILGRFHHKLIFKLLLLSLLINSMLIIINMV